MVTDKRMNELLLKESKLQALENGGVDNWEWYNESLKEWRKENEENEVTAIFIYELNELIAESEVGHEGHGMYIINTNEDDLTKLVAGFIKSLGEL